MGSPREARAEAPGLLLRGVSGHERQGQPPEADLRRTRDLARAGQGQEEAPAGRRRGGGEEEAARARARQRRDDGDRVGQVRAQLPRARCQGQHGVGHARVLHHRPARARAVAGEGVLHPLQRPRQERQEEQQGCAA